MKPPKIQLVKPGSRMDGWLTRQFSSSLFSYRDIFGMLGPLVLDQFFVYLISMLTTSMISASSQESVSAVSLVSPITYLVMAIFGAVSSGGAVVVAQYKGRGDEQKVRRSAGQVVCATFLVALIACTLLVCFAGPIIDALFGAAEPIIRQKARDYLVGFSLSMIPFSLYSSVFAVFRGIGATKTCLRLTIIINLIHLFASMLFLNVLKLDIVGTALSYLIARIIGGGVALYLLMGSHSIIRVPIREIARFDFAILKSIFKLGVPFAVEQVFFNGGNLLAQTYLVRLGTVSVAANAIGTSAFGLLYAAGLSVGTLSLTVIGQCIGAGDTELARRYGKRMIFLGIGVIVLSIAILYPLMPLILRLYAPEPETLVVINRIILVALIPMPFFWATSNVTPNMLNAAGDANFTSLISLMTMWVVRIAGGYVAAITLGFGVEGIWFMMGFEWVVRSVIYLLRFHGKRWLLKKTIE